MERFKAARHTESTTHTPRTYHYAFEHTTEIELSRYRGFVSVNHDGIRHLFTVENYETELQRISAALGNKGNAKIQVRWNETGADLYTPTGAFLLECLPTEKAHKSHAEATAETYDALQIWTYSFTLNPTLRYERVRNARKRSARHYRFAHRYIFEQRDH